MQLNIVAFSYTIVRLYKVLWECIMFCNASNIDL